MLWCDGMSSTRYIDIPHLPAGRAEDMIIGERYRARLEPALEKLGISVIWLPDNPGVNPRVAGHADLAAVHLGGNRLLLAREYMTNDSLVNIFTNRGYELFWPAMPLTAKYPGDCGLNACILGGCIVHKAVITDPELKSRFDAGHTINVSQGYTKCSVCVAGKNAVITADHGIAKALHDRGIGVLEICPGHIALDGYDAGFIGGSAFMISQSELAFTGRLDDHPDKARIESFLRVHGVSPVYLTDDAVFDIGSAVPLTERVCHGTVSAPDALSMYG